MEIKVLQKTIAALADKKDWGNTPADVNFAEKIALLHGEVSEALEAYRKGNLNGKDGVAEELADIVLRTVHLAHIYGIDLEAAIASKMALNNKRDWSTDQLHLDRKKNKQNQ